MSDEPKDAKSSSVVVARTHYPKRAGVLARAREILEMDLPPDHELRTEAKKFARYGMLNEEWHENARIGAARLLAELVGAAQSGQDEPQTAEDWAQIEAYAAEQKGRLAR